MEIFLISAFISLINSKPEISPAFIDLIKLVAGITIWIGGLAFFMYRREKKLKLALDK
jgi:hypothetical protein